MIWLENLYLSENIHGSDKYVKWMVEKGVSIRPIYLIVLSNMKDGQLEIIPLYTTKIPFLKQNNYYIIGVAKGYYHARSLVEYIVSEVYEITHDFQLKEYFMKQFIKEKKKEE